MTTGFQSFGKSALGVFNKSTLGVRDDGVGPRVWFAGMSNSSQILYSAVASGASGWAKTSLSGPRYPWWTYNGYTFGFALGSSGSKWSDLYVTANGITWAKRVTSSFTASPRMAKTASGRLILTYSVGTINDGTTVLYSDNYFTSYSTVSTFTVPGYIQPSPIKQFAGGRLVFGLQSYSTPYWYSRVCYSDDNGASWNSVALPSRAGWINNFFYDSSADTMYLVCRDFDPSSFLTNYLYSSTDGTTWTKIKDLSATDCSWNRSAQFFNHDSYRLSSGRIICDMGGLDDTSMHVHYSDDNGQTWHSGVTEWRPLRKKSGVLYTRKYNSGGIDNKIVQSSDGSTWSDLVTLESLDTSDTIGLSMNDQEDN